MGALVAVLKRWFECKQHMRDADKVKPIWTLTDSSDRRQRCVSRSGGARTTRVGRTKAIWENKVTTSTA